jgi:glycerophosphoryl diester phosphodiesterase
MSRSTSFPRIIAHRGARGHAPENTHAAFNLAYRMGAEGIELDVQCCATGEVVVIHDETVDRTSNGTGVVSELSLSQLKEMDFGQFYSPTFAGERIPTLAEVIDALPAQAVINIEIKNKGTKTNGEEAGVAALVRRSDLYDRVIVSSFNPFVLRRMRRTDPRVPIAYLYEAKSPLFLRPLPVRTLLRPNALHPDFQLVTRQMVRAAHRRGYAVNTWTVNEPADLARMIACGVDSIITDYPDRLAALREASAK